MLRKIAVRANIIYVFGLVIIFAGAIWMRVNLPPMPFSDRDTWGYLQPALSQLATGSLDPTHRGFLYPAVLGTILKIWPNFVAISVVQHGAGLIAGVFLVVAWQRMRIFLPLGRVVQPCYFLAGWLMLTVYLFSYASILYEHTIRPEAFFPLITILCILLATEVSRRILIKSSRTISYAILVVLLTVLSFANYYLKPAWGLALLVAMAPIMAIPGQVVTRKLLPLCVGFLIVLALFIVPERSFHRTVNGNSSFLARTAFCASGEIIYGVLKQDSSLPASDPLQTAAQQLLPYFEAAMQPPHRSLPFGFSRLNPDTLMYGGAMDKLRKMCHENTEELIAACFTYYWRAWFHDPLAMLRKIVLQIVYFYCPWKSVIYAQGQDFHLTARLQESLSNLQMIHNESSYSWPPYQKYKQQLQAWVDQMPNRSIPSFIVALSTLLNPLYTPIVLLSAGLALWTLLSKTSRFSGLQPSARWCLYLLSYNFAMTFTIAVVHIVAVDRYHFSQTIFSILSQSFAAIFLICAVSHLRGHSSVNAK
ncbi:MAG: hypothetical protein C5B47_00010 [Verrucomicrobia bacterium]|nr:MAG: hypothetical protein C5B47_00010 [Verrucomicrobiota bacterium]